MLRESIHNEKPKRIDWFDISVIFALISAVFADAIGWFGVLISAIVPLGIIMGPLVALTHYFAAFFVLLLIYPQIHHFVPKLILLIGILLPIPLFSGLIILAIISQNRVIEFLVTQAAIQGAALAGAALGGVGAVVVEGVGETAAIGGTAAEAGVAGAETATAGARAVKGAGTLAERAENLRESGGFKEGIKTFEKIRDKYEDWEDADSDEAYRINKERDAEALAGIPDIEQEADQANFPGLDNVTSRTPSQPKSDNSLYAEKDSKNVTIRNNGSTVDLRRGSSSNATKKPAA